MDRLILIPRWGGRADDDFYAWLARRLRELGWRGEMETAALRPTPEPEVDLTVTAVRARIGPSARGARTVLLGHSVGAQAAMRAAAARPPGAELAGLVLVAAWWTIDRPSAALARWVEAPLDWSRVRAAARRRVALVSTDDPYTADAARTRRLVEERIAAEVHVCDRAGHFNAAEEPRVLTAVRDLLGV